MLSGVLAASLGAASMAQSPQPPLADSVIITPADPTSVQRGIEAAYNAGEKKVVIPAGVYRLPEIAGSTRRLDLEDMKNFEIEATGVTFVIPDREPYSVLFNRCEKVTFRGATLVREVPPFSQGKIESIASDRQSVVVRVDKGYPSDLDDKKYFPHLLSFDTFQPGTRKFKPHVPYTALSGVDRLGDDLFRFNCRAAVDPQIPLAVGDPIAWRGVGGFDVALWQCAGMRMENVTLKNGSGIGFFEICGEGGNQYIGCTITYAAPPPGAVDQPLLACGVDGFHSASARQGPVLENCLFEGLDDDPLNIHGAYALLMDIQDNTFIVDWHSPHRAARDPISFGQVGDTVRLYDRQGTLSGEAKIVTIRSKTDYQPSELPLNVSRIYKEKIWSNYEEIVLDHPVAGEKWGTIANSNMTGNGFIIRKCTFRNSKGHGMFIRGSEGLIEGCTVEGTTMGGIVLAPEMNSWNEADYPRDIMIRGNTIRNVGIATQPWNSGITVAGFEYGGFCPLPGGPQNITIQDNLFEDNPGPNLVITSSTNVKIVGNRFIKPMTTPAFHIENYGINNISALIWIRNSKGVELTQNKLISPGPYFKDIIDADASVSAEGLSDGIVLQP